MWHLLTGPVRVVVAILATGVLAATGCADGEPAALSPDAEATIVAAVDATVSARLAVTPTATPVPAYTPQLSDYIAALGDRYPRGGTTQQLALDKFDDYGAVYLTSAWLGERALNRDVFVSFVRTYSSSDLLSLAMRLLGDVAEKVDRGDNSDWVQLYFTDPADEEASVVACRLSRLAVGATTSPFFVEHVAPTAEGCPLRFAEYLAGLDPEKSVPRGWLDWIGTSMGVDMDAVSPAP